MYQEEIHIKRLTRQDINLARQLILLFDDVFETEHPCPDETYQAKLLEYHDFMVYVAMKKDEVVGGLTAYELPMFSGESTEVFIYDLAVKPEFQRQGVGKRLISAIREYCRQQGIKDIFVVANEEDAHAVNFYRNTGGKMEKVNLFTYAVEHQ